MNRLEDPTGALHRKRARCAGHTDLRGGGGRTPREHEPTHMQRTRGTDPKANQTEPAERTDRMEWRTGGRREGTPGRNNPQHAPRGARGKGGTRGEMREPAPGPTPLTYRERRAHTTRALHPPRQ